MDKFTKWVDRVQDECGRFSYRYVYGAFLAASSRFEVTGGETTMKVLPDGGYVLKAGRNIELNLVDDAEREALADYLVARYCRDVYPNMAAWENQQHTWCKEDSAW